MRKATIYLDDDANALESAICGLATVDPGIRPTLVKVLDNGGLRLAATFSREIDPTELIEAGVVQVDEDAGYVVS